jgi:predicted AAA+ superfamily ATPase
MIAIELIKQILIEQREAILQKEIGVERNVLAEIQEKKDLPFVHVITGIRRCGKSTLLRQVIKKLCKDTDFYYVNFEDERLFNFESKDFNYILESLIGLFGPQKTIFIDEIQNVLNFENFVRRLSDSGYKFYITGSNANLLSKEIGSKLTGRHIDTYLTPFSFSEYLRFVKYLFKPNSIYKTTERATIKKHFLDYFLQGGMPEFLIYNDYEILAGTYEDIVIKDIAVRYNIDNYIQLKELYQFVITNFGKRFSYNSLRKAVDLGSVSTVQNYLQYFEGSYLGKRVNKFEYSLKKQIANEKKMYIIDNAFISIISKSFTKDKGWLLENLVFNVLNSIYDVYYYSGKNDCDFVCVKNKNIAQLVQVTYGLELVNEEREIAGLREAMIVYSLKKGLILTFDTEKEINIPEGEISVLPLWKYLLKEIKT